MVNRNGLEELQQTRPLEPRHVAAGPHHVVAFQRADGQEVHVRRGLLQEDTADKFAIFRFDGAEDSLVVTHRVHLVHGHHEVRDAEQRRDEPVPARLLQNAVARVDQNHR